jgi:hypothetical protein
MTGSECLLEVGDVGAPSCEDQAVPAALQGRNGIVYHSAVSVMIRGEFFVHGGHAAGL